MNQFADFDIRQWLTDGFVSRAQRREETPVRKRPAAPGMAFVATTFIASALIWNVGASAALTQAQTKWSESAISQHSEDHSNVDVVSGVPSIYWARLAKEINRMPLAEDLDEIDFPPLV